MKDLLEKLFVITMIIASLVAIAIIGISTKTAQLLFDKES